LVAVRRHSLPGARNCARRALGKNAAAKATKRAARARVRSSDDVPRIAPEAMPAAHLRMATTRAASRAHSKGVVRRTDSLPRVWRLPSRSTHSRDRQRLASSQR